MGRERRKVIHGDEFAVISSHWLDLLIIAARVPSCLLVTDSSLFSQHSKCPLFPDDVIVV